MVLKTMDLASINTVVVGLEIAACVAFSFAPPLLLKSGFSETQMSIILGVAPLLALLTVPLIGSLSDSCTSRFGRRRPFIFFFSVLLVISVLMLLLSQANSPVQLEILILIIYVVLR